MDCSIPSSVSCYASRTFQPCGFTPLRRLTPRPSCPHFCSGSRPWGSSSFHLTTEVFKIPAMRFLPFEAFPPPIAVVRWTLRRRLATRAVHAGRLSPPARLSPCSAAHLAMCLEAVSPSRPEGPLSQTSKRSHAPKVHQPPYRLAVQSQWEVAFPLRPRTSRCFSIVGSVVVPPFPANPTRCSRGLGLLIPPRLRGSGEESVRQR